jgi:hypothetical protein
MAPFCDNTKLQSKPVEKSFLHPPGNALAYFLTVELEGGVFACLGSILAAISVSSPRRQA